MACGLWHGTGKEFRRTNVVIRSRAIRHQLYALVLNGIRFTATPGVSLMPCRAFSL
jgi:hypothetical protein